MRKYDKEFKEKAVKLSDKVGVKQAAAQLVSREVRNLGAPGNELSSIANFIVLYLYG